MSNSQLLTVVTVKPPSGSRSVMATKTGCHHDAASHRFRNFGVGLGLSLVELDECPGVEIVEVFNSTVSGGGDADDLCQGHRTLRNLDGDVVAPCSRVFCGKLAISSLPTSDVNTVV